MPSTSPAQARLMAAVAHGWHKPGGGGPPVSVAKEFNQADAGHHAFAQGGPVTNKGYLGKSTGYAAGGPVLGRTRDFTKIPDQFTDGRLPPKDVGRKDDPEQDYEKPRKGSAPPATGKQLKTVKPQ